LSLIKDKWGKQTEEIYVNIKSSTFDKSDDVCAFSETFSAQHKVVFADETHLASARSAFTTVFSIFTGVGSPKKVGHLW